MVSRLPLRYVGIATALWMLPNFAHAQQAASIQETIAWAVTWAIAAMNLGIWIVFTMLTQLLDTSMFLNTNMANTLNEVWQLARDLVNIAFAVVLVGSAVYTVVTSNREFIAEHLKKFVLAVVLVNFSWFIPRVIIDVGNIAAATVFDIPSMLTQGEDGLVCTYRSPVRINGNGITCTNIPDTDPVQYECDCAAVIDARYFVSKTEAADLTSADGWTPILGNTLYVRLTNLNTIQDAAPSSVVLNGLIINHARLMGLASVPPAARNDDITALIMFLLQEAIVLILHAALFFPLAAMLLAFAIRIPVLWLTIAFMPFMVLKFVVPEQYTGEYPQKIWDNFLKAAFLPAIVGIPLTVGFIMVNAGQKANILSPLRGISFPVSGSISDYQQLLWLIMVIGIIWVGVFTTLEKMEIMGKGASAIKGAGEMLGKTALRAPLSVPLIPNTNISLLSMARQPRRISSAFENNDTFDAAMDDLRRGGASDKIQKSAQKHALDTKKLTELNKDMQELTQAIKNNKPAEDQQKIRERVAVNLSAPISNSVDLDKFISAAEKIEGTDNAVLSNLKATKAALEAAEKSAPKTP
jgi:hypothetical protein